MVFMTGGAFTAAAREFLERVANPRIDKPIVATALLAVLADLASTPVTVGRETPRADPVKVMALQLAADALRRRRASGRCLAA